MPILYFPIVSKMSWKLFFLCLSSFSVINARLQGEGIIEGNIAEENQFPYQVTILSEFTKLICGGGILDDYHILTAAHCVIGPDNKFKGKPLSIVVGTNDVEKRNFEGIWLKVEKIFAHAEYDRKSVDLLNDIAVLRLSRSLKISKHPELKALKLPTDAKETYANKEARIAGSGYDRIRIVLDRRTNQYREQGGIIDSHLKYIDVDILDSDECQKLEKNLKKISAGHLCAKAKVHAGRKPSGVCSGDSGGPLVYGNDTVIGIVSTSPIGCRENKLPAVYTRVSEYLTFIDKAKKDDVDASIRTYEFQ